MTDQATPSPASPTLPPAPTSGLAIASLVLGIFSFPLGCAMNIELALVAIIFGVIALKNIRKSGGVLRGRGQAIAGISIGSFNIFL